MKRLLPGLLVILCSLPAFAQKTPYGGTITIAYSSEPTSLNPLVEANGPAALIESFFTNGLTKSNAQGEVVPDLAESWDVSADGLTWTFRFKPDIKFSDGSLLTMDDVLSTFKAAIDPGLSTRSSTLAQLVDRFSIEGDRVFRIILKQPYGQLPLICERPILKASEFEGSGAAGKNYSPRPLGTGPFKVASWEKGQIVLTSNPDYFQGRPHLDKVIFKFFADQKKAWTSLMQGETDLVVDVDNEDFLIIKDDKRFTVYDYLDVFCIQLLFNTQDPLFSQPAIRRAISAAIDRRDLVDKALEGGGVPTTGPFQPGTWPYNPDPSLQSYDPTAASKALSDLGWRDTDGDWVREKGGTKLQFTVLIPEGDKLMEQTGKRLQWQLLQAGIRMDVEMLSFADMLQNRISVGKYQALLLTFNAFLDPNTTVSSFWQTASIGGYNLSRYSNPEVDALAAQGRTATTQEAKTRIYRGIHAIISRDAPAAFLYFKKRYTAMSSRLQGFVAGASSLLIDSLNNWYVTR